MTPQKALQEVRTRFPAEVKQLDPQTGFNYFMVARELAMTCENTAGEFCDLMAFAIEAMATDDETSD